MNIMIPSDVPPKKQERFRHNMQILTKQTNRIFLFSCDQKIEHLHDDFNPSQDDDIPDDIMDPKHFFQIGADGRIGALATQLELIARYATQFDRIDYVAKLNSKTNLIPPEQKEPLSGPLWHVKEVADMIEHSKLSIPGIGVTVYLGSEFEDEMMHFAAQSIFEAHKQGLVAILWMYPRGKAVTDDTDPHIIAGAAGAANALGADVVKIKPPHATQEKTGMHALQEVVAAAGNTKVIVSGGSKQDPETFLQALHTQLHEGQSAGTATGRNIFQHTLTDAIAMTKAISALVYDNASVKNALSYIK